MKNNGIKKFLSGLLAGFVCLSALPTVQMGAHAEKTLTTSPSQTQVVGWYNDYHHEIWQADTPNSSTMTLYDQGGGFSTTWKCGPNGSQGNFLARRGLFYDLGNTKHWQDYGGFTCDFDCDWSAGSSGNSRICIYGWTQNPLVEYYIIEDWKNWSPAQDGNAVYKGSEVIDGSTYDIYTCARNSYTIEGNKPFTQYISIRKDLRTSGTISISKHFETWESLGMEMGGLYEVAFNVEGWESDGQASVNCTIAEGTSPIIIEPEKDPEPDENGYFFHSTFEDGKDSWSSRGDAVTVANDSKSYTSGTSSLAVSGRQDAWQGTSYSLSNKTFVPGKTYSFSTGVLQTSGEDVEMKLTLQYKDSSGKENYDSIAAVNAESGKWAVLENTAYTIPTGASSMLLYVETEDGKLIDFNIDDAIGAVEGTKSPINTASSIVNGSAVTTATSTTTTTTTSTTTTTTTTTTTAETTTTTKEQTTKSETTSTTATTKTPESTKTETTAETQPVAADRWGDANCDGNVNMSDVVLIMQTGANPGQYKLSDQGKINADVIGADGVTNNDALTIQRFEAGLIDTLPVDYPANYTPAASTTKKPETTTEKAATTVKTTEETTTTAKQTTTTTTKETTTEQTTTTTEPVVETVYISNSFENGADGWESRGGATVKTDSDSYYSGGQSLYVSGRSKDWQGAAVSLDGKAEAGKTYSISAAVMQSSAATVEMKITLQYIDAAGDTQYDNIASADAASQVWTAIGNTEYTIPEGAKDLLLYVETTDSLTNYYLDNVQVASKGMKSDVTTGGGTVNIPEHKVQDGVDISWIDPSKPMVAISFDDGTRDAANEQKIIDSLVANGFHATFFYVGDWITPGSGEQVIKNAYAAGMEIANHTTSHPYLTKISSAEVRSEYDTTQAKLKNIIGAEPSKLMRLPFLDVNDSVKQTLYDVPLISCAIDTADWNGASKDQIVATIKNNMSNGNLNGAIVLCHENYTTTSSAMEEVLPYLKAQGWQVVTISEMFAVKGQELQGGTVYTRCS